MSRSRSWTAGAAFTAGVPSFGSGGVMLGRARSGGRAVQGPGVGEPSWRPGSPPYRGRAASLAVLGGQALGRRRPATATLMAQCDTSTRAVAGPASRASPTGWWRRSAVRYTSTRGADGGEHVPVVDRLPQRATRRTGRQGRRRRATPAAVAGSAAATRSAKSRSGTALGQGAVAAQAQAGRRVAPGLGQDRSGHPQAERGGQRVGHAGVGRVGVGVRGEQRAAAADQPVHGAALEGVRGHAVHRLRAAAGWWVTSRSRRSQSSASSITAATGSTANSTRPTGARGSPQTRPTASQGLPGSSADRMRLRAGRPPRPGSAFRYSPWRKVYPRRGRADRPRAAAQEASLLDKLGGGGPRPRADGGPDRWERGFQVTRRHTKDPARSALGEFLRAAPRPTQRQLAEAAGVESARCGLRGRGGPAAAEGVGPADLGRARAWRPAGRTGWSREPGHLAAGADRAGGDDDSGGGDGPQLLGVLGPPTARLGGSAIDLGRGRLRTVLACSRCIRTPWSTAT